MWQTLKFRLTSILVVLRRWDSVQTSWDRSPLLVASLGGTGRLAVGWIDFSALSRCSATLWFCCFIQFTSGKLPIRTKEKEWYSLLTGKGGKIYVFYLKPWLILQAFSRIISILLRKFKHTDLCCGLTIAVLTKDTVSACRFWGICCIMFLHLLTAELSR